MTNVDYDLLKIQQEYLSHALTFYSGIKVLLLDPITTPIVGHLFSMMDVCQKEIYLVANLLDAKRESVFYATAICVLHPSKQSIERLIEELIKLEVLK